MRSCAATACAAAGQARGQRHAAADRMAYNPAEVAGQPARAASGRSHRTQTAISRTGSAARRAADTPGRAAADHQPVSLHARQLMTPGASRPMTATGKGPPGICLAGILTGDCASHNVICMWDGPGFLDLPARDRKPRLRELTHVLDKGTTIPELEAVLASAGHLIDVFKIGWGISYVDRTVKERVTLCSAAGVTVCLGGTLLEVCAAQGKVDELRGWAIDLGVDAVEVSNGLGALRTGHKTGL